MSRLKKSLFYLALVALPVAAVLLGIAFVLPWFVPAPSLAYHFWGNRPVSFLPGVPQRAVTANYDTRFRANAFGFNDVEHALAKPPGRLRVLLLGDSMVEGIQVRPEEHMARRIEALAAADGG